MWHSSKLKKSVVFAMNHQMSAEGLPPSVLSSYFLHIISSSSVMRNGFLPKISIRIKLLLLRHKRSCSSMKLYRWWVTSSFYFTLNLICACYLVLFNSSWNHLHLTEQEHTFIHWVKLLNFTFLRLYVSIKGNHSKYSSYFFNTIPQMSGQ